MQARAALLSDRNIVNGWLRERKLPEIHDFSDMGCIVPGIAVAYFRMISGGYAILDAIISNPGASSDDRDAALDLIFENMVNAAKSMGLKGIIGWSIDKNTIARAKRFGFIKKPHVVMCLALE